MKALRSGGSGVTPGVASPSASAIRCACMARISSKSFNGSSAAATARRCVLAFSGSSACKSRSQGVCGGWYRLVTRAPSRCLVASLNEGWKKFTNSREAPYRRVIALAAAIPAKTSMTEELAHHGAVLLFDPSLIVLPVWTRASQFNALAQAVLDQMLIYKFGAVVDVERAESKGQPDTDALEGLNNQTAFADDDWRRLGPTAADV